MPIVKIATESDLPALNEAKEFPCGDKTICVANVNGEISAMDNICLHRGGPLGQGVISGGKVICPWHGWEFDLRTGKSWCEPDRTKVRSFELKVEAGGALVEGALQAETFPVSTEKQYVVIEV